MNDLLGKYAIITGAAGGIGSATAEVFAQEGAEGIVIADIDFLKATQICERIKEKTKCVCIPIKTNVANNQEIQHLFTKTLSTFGTLDILVNCAGICTVSSIEDIGEAEWDIVMGVNLKSAYLCSREAYNIMKVKKYGKIINVSSISGRVGGIKTGVNYAVSKGAIISLTMSFAKAGGPYNINVNCVAPGFIDTDMTKNFTHFDPETVPLRRIGTPKDVTYVIGFLASDKSSYITGLTIDINGGTYMG
jgi:3-oxoacyl-[acyl-carrier protein] reductase